MRNTYSDGTPITAPFWVVRCTSSTCKHAGWDTHKSNICKKCGAEATCVPANEDKKKPA